jgi:hypothetical protein
MNDQIFEGTLVLEKLAEANKLEAFYDAVDSDDFEKAKSIMLKANIDRESIAIVLKQMQDQ